MTIDRTINTDEYAHEAKQILRGFLRSNGWRRCGRTKKYEVYKIMNDDVQYRVKFENITVTFERFEKSIHCKNFWVSMRRLYWRDIISIRNLENFIPFNQIPEYSSEEEELDEYLHRIGVFA
jgi:hypothetical protein